MSTQSKEVREFIDDIIGVCIKHGMSIGHEDAHGNFIITDYSDYHVGWFANAIDETEEKR